MSEEGFTNFSERGEFYVKLKLNVENLEMIESIINLLKKRGVGK